MGLRETIESLDFSDKKTQIGIAAFGLAAGYVILQKRKTPEKGTDAASATPTIDYATHGTTDFGGSPGVLGNVGSYPVPGTPIPQKQYQDKELAGAQGNCKQGQVGVLRGGKIVCVGASTTASKISCPAGYMVAGAPGKERCTKINDTTPGKTTYRPPTPKKAAGGEAFQAVSAMDSYAGKVGGFFPHPMPLAPRHEYTVQQGDTLQTISRKVYGSPLWIQKLMAYNGGLQELRVGDRLDIGS